MNTQELTEAIKALEYPQYGTYMRGAPANLFRDKRNEYKAKVRELEDQWQAWLHEEYSPEFTEVIHNLLFEQAWSEAHSYGYSEVESSYQEQVDFANKLFELRYK